jgi:Cof subfamily protein (haloacid dehalogenase superfamily)
LDGTLLRPDRTLCPEGADALRQASARGIRVVLATARPPRATRRFYDALGLDTPTINYNGAVVYDPKAGVALSHEPLAAAAAREVVRVARETDPEVWVSIEVMDTWHTDRVDEALTTETARLFAPDYVGPLDDVLSRDVTKVMLLAEPDRLVRVRGAVAGRMDGLISMAMSDGHLLQVMNPAVDKAVALARLAAAFGVEPARILAIGDAPNDTGMLRYAGMGVAMGNGWDEPKAAAKAVAPANDAGGVAWAVRTFALRGK